MRTHGSTLSFRFVTSRAEAKEDKEAATCPVPHAELHGYRHFLRNPRPEERFSIGERDPRDAEDETRSLMKRLADCMWSRGPSWPAPLAEGLERWENSDIPAGYTYFAQLMMHDLVNSADPLPGDPKARVSIRNYRVSRLAFDTLYDSGPAGCPVAYVQHEDRKPRMRMRLGPVGTPDQQQVMRDIRRVGLPVDSTGEAAPQDMTEALVADSRNDDNLILAQLTALFHMLHNTVIDTIHGIDPIAPGIDSFEATRRHFTFAREIVGLVFRSCVRHDLLSRLLHPKIYKRYADNPVFMDQGSGMPLEFAHGAGRFGHAMVRPFYRLNRGVEPVHSDRLLRLTSGWTPGMFPLDRSFLIEWSRFFAFPGAARPNYSRRLEPSMEKLDSGDSRDIHSLPERDLLRGASLGLWSVWALRKEIERRAPGTTGLSSVLSDPDEARKKIAAFLTEQVDRTGLLNADDIAKIAADPPLSFFVLFEAAQAPGQGRYLGVLGSVIVAEVVFGALAAAGSRSVRDIARQIYGVGGPDVGALADRMARIDSLPELIRFVAEANRQPTDAPLI